MTSLATNYETPNYTLKSEELGKVAVLMGGLSAERDVSLKSGTAVLSALQQRNIDAHGIDVGENIIEVLQAGDFDRAFIILHGRGGEDGVIQAVLETLRIPYTGSGVLGSALCMDKIKSKQVWHAAGLSTPHFVVLDKQSRWFEVAAELGLPIAVKPVREGSSLGTTRVELSEKLEDAWRTAANFDDDVMAEPWVGGEEYTVAILAGVALPIIRLDTPREFYDYEAKYESNDTSYHCPCGLDGKTEQRLQKLALKAFNVLGARSWGRVDLIVGENGQPWLLENNTVPGMTDHSLVPMAAKEAGIEFDELVWRILCDAQLEAS
ncbi:MAG: D-alanine--D-alanine ligase [Gammaproteobacteria bacterium]